MRFDAIVIGAGALGTFHAFSLAKLGKKVLVLEKDFVPREATVRNFGQVVPSGFPIGRWHYYGRYSTQLYMELQSKSDIGIRQNGSLYVASDETEMAVLIEMHQKFIDVDYPSFIYTKEQVLNYSPAFKKDYVVGGLYFPQEVSSESRRMIKSVQDLLVEQWGVKIRYNTAVVGVESNDTSCKVFCANGDKFETDKVFICNGRDFSFLYPEIFNQANITVTKLQMMSTQPVDFKLKGNILTGLTIRRYESFKSCDSYKALDSKNAKTELTDKGIHILFKQRDDGSIVIGDSHVYADIQKGYDAGFDEEVQINDLILNEAKSILNVPDLKINHLWSGFYSQMKGDEEIFEKVIDGKIFIATAIGGKGMTASAGYADEKISELFD